MSVNLKYWKRGAVFVVALLFMVVFADFAADAFAQGEGVPKGSLLTPSQVEGAAHQQYDAGIKAGDGDLVTLVIQVTNYVLGFVAMIALVAIIYAGILYVANFGNDDMTSKAKTIIIYTTIGILVIILSYAFVNAIIGAVDDGSGGAGNQCSITNPCATGLVCSGEQGDTNRECVLPRDIGEFQGCENDSQCSSPLICKIPSGESKGLCRVPGSGGELSGCRPNAIPRECASSLVCFDDDNDGFGRCRVPRDVGEFTVCSTADGASACSDGLTCVDDDRDGAGVCRIVVGSGIPCSSNADDSCPLLELCIENSCGSFASGPTGGSSGGGFPGGGSGGALGGGLGGAVQAGDIVQAILAQFRRLGDVCPSTVIGLRVNDFGCASNQVLADTDADSIINIIDTDDDNDGITDEIDTDDDGDGVSDATDVCLDTLSFRAFDVSGLQKGLNNGAGVSQQEYDAALSSSSFPGCALYQISADIDGDSVVDHLDCDADSDGLLDNEDCLREFASAGVGDPSVANSSEVSDRLLPARGITKPVSIDEVDRDDDDDGVNDYGVGETAQSVNDASVTLAKTIEQLSRSILVTCARLPETTDVLSFCARADTDGDGDLDPVGGLVQLVERLTGNPVDIAEWEEFRRLHTQFQILVREFPKVEAVFFSDIDAGELPPGRVGLPVNFDASKTFDPYGDVCPVDNADYFWFVDETIDWTAGLQQVLDKGSHVGTGVFFSHSFTEPGVYNVQLLVRSACSLGEVVPQTATGLVDAAMAGLASIKIKVRSPRAEIEVLVDDAQTDPGFSPVDVLAEQFVTVSFDLRGSSTNRGPFTQLSYNCEGSDSRTIDSPENQWRFQCNWEAPTGRKKVSFFATDRDGVIERSIELVFKNVVSFIDVTPIDKRGTVETDFIFDGSRSRARGGRISNYTWSVTRETNDIAGLLVEEVFEDSGGDESLSYRFDSDGPGHYIIELTVSVGSGSPATAFVEVDVVPREPVPVFTALFTDDLLPGRVFLDASASFHPDDPNETIPLSYSWKVDGVNLHVKSGSSDPGPFFERVVQGPSGIDDIVFFDFARAGVHSIELTVSRANSSASLERSVTVNSVLGVDFAMNKTAVHAGDAVRFTPSSPRAAGFFWNFGDDFTLVSDSNAVSHKYESQGVYSVTLEVEDSLGDTNSVTKKVRVGLADEPVAVIQPLVRGKEQIPKGGLCGSNSGITLTRRDSLILDASDSISVKGETTGLTYLWEIGQETRARGVTTSVRFDELRDSGCELIKLIITDDITSEEDTSRLGIKIVNMDPELQNVRVFTPVSQVTPVTVPVQVVGDRDEDGSIREYKWWYYAEGKKAEKLGVHVTQKNSTQFVLGPKGVEGQKVKYHFVVEITDNDGAVVNSETLVGASEGLLITNGPNVVPVAEFIVDSTNLKVGERVSFTSTTRDPLGDYIPSGAYQWDFEGDGKFEKGITGSKVSHIYAVPGVYRPLLRVVKNGLSTTYDMEIRVLPNTEKPEAAFLFVKSGSEVTFINNSIVDSTLKDKEIRYAWDFDTSVDTDGNGESDDDIDSALPNPMFEFIGSKDYEVRLMVTDAMDNTDDVRRIVEFIVKADRGALGASSKSRLKPVLETNPTRNNVDGKVYLRPPTGDVIFLVKKSTGKIQEYRIDTNLKKDSDGDGIPNNDIDNKTHASWKDGSPFRFRYNSSDGPVRMGLLVVDVSGEKKGTAVDIIFSADDMNAVFSERLANPDSVLTVLDTIPVVSFSTVAANGASADFVSVGEEVSFDATRTRFPDEKVKEYLWDFDGDGLVDEVSFEPGIAHTYTKEGVYTVFLEAASDEGLTGEYSQTIIVRGGLALPTASFTFQKDGRALQFVNGSLYDPSFSEDEVSFEWSFSKLQLGATGEWVLWKKELDYSIGFESLGGVPIWATNSVSWSADSDFKGALPRTFAVGNGRLVALFEEGELLLSQPDSLPFSGVLSLQERTAGTGELAVIDTGLDTLLLLDKGVRIIFDGVVRNGVLNIESSDGESTVAGEVTKNKTVFFTQQYGGLMRLVGDEEPAVEIGEFLGVSSVFEPLKVFEELGTYRVELTVVDGVGEQSTASEVITMQESDFAADVKLEEEFEVVDLEPIIDIVDEEIDKVVNTVRDIDLSEFSDPKAPPVSEQNSSSLFLKIGLGVFVLLLIAGVLTFLVQIVRRKVAQSSVSAPKDSSIIPTSLDSQVVEAEVIEPPNVAKEGKDVSADTVVAEVVEKKESSQKIESNSKKEKAIVPKKASAPVVAEKKKPAEKTVSRKSKSKGPSAESGAGPIPDWLKG